MDPETEWWKAKKHDIITGVVVLILFIAGSFSQLSDWNRGSIVIGNMPWHLYDK